MYTFQREQLCFRAAFLHKRPFMVPEGERKSDGLVRRTEKEKNASVDFVIRRSERRQDWVGTRYFVREKHV